MENLALNKPALQSSTCEWSMFRDPSQDASNANNGDKDHSQWFHTAFENNPWWQVDLGDLFLIHQVRIFNRIGVRDRFLHFSILGSHDGQSWFDCVTQSSKEAFDDITLDLGGECLARFVRIRLIGPGYLHLRECEVFGGVCDAAMRDRLVEVENNRRRRQDRIPEGRTGVIAFLGGFRVYIDDAYGESVKSALLSDSYESIERDLTRNFLTPADEVLEVGAAVGVVSMTAASIVGARNVLAFDANPRMTQDARENFERNEMSEITVRCGLLANRSKYRPGATEKFGISGEFWASRLVSGPEPDIVEYVDTPYFCLEDEIAAFGANVLICDIEGAEVELLHDAELSALKLIVLETHYWARGERATDDMIRALVHRGFSIHLGASRFNVVVLRR